MLVTSDFSKIISYNPGLRQNASNAAIAPAQPTNDEITTARLKKTLSQCRYIVIAACIFYFAVKKRLYVNEVINEEIKRNQINKLKKPIINIPA